MMETHRFGGPWTVEKLDAVRAFLSAYTQALTGDRAAKWQEAQTVLEISELYAMTKGSARVTLEIEPHLDRCIFIEK